MAKNITLKEALKTERLTPFGNAVAGAMGAVVSSALVYPLDTYVSTLDTASYCQVLLLIASCTRRQGQDANSGLVDGFECGEIGRT